MTGNKEGKNPPVWGDFFLGGLICVTGLPGLCPAMTSGMKGRGLVVWGVGLRDPIPTCVGMTKVGE